MVLYHKYYYTSLFSTNDVPPSQLVISDMINGSITPYNKYTLEYDLRDPNTVVFLVFCDDVK